MVWRLDVGTALNNCATNKFDFIFYTCRVTCKLTDANFFFKAIHKALLFMFFDFNPNPSNCTKLKNIFI